MRLQILSLAVATGVILGYPNAAADNKAGPARTGRRAREKPSMTAARSKPVSDTRLEITLEFGSAVVRERLPMHTAVLHVRNRSKEPLRLYLPVGAAFRANISTLIFSPEGARPLFVPEPRPHGYVVTEKDFHLLAPGASRAFTQRFTVERFVPGGGQRTARLAGFEQGKRVPVTWIVENRLRRWKGGAQTLDGPTRELFGGQEIPFIWTGKLTARMSWTAP